MPPISRSAFLKQASQQLGSWLTEAVTETVKENMAPTKQLLSIENTIACIEITECTAYKGTGCKSCYDACPIQEVAIVLNENLPQVVAQGCTGCSLCIPACPTPNAIFLKAVQ